VSLDRAVLDASAVINCAGPFIDTAIPIIEAALRSGIHYFDVAAEQAAVLAVFERFSCAAKQTGVVIAPAMAFYGGLGDLLATAAMGDWSAADEILIGTPMYNFTVPANLKAWIDLIVRPRVTHSGPPERKGLVLGKTCKIIIASGGTYDEGLPAAASDHESGYLKRILAFIGITEVEVILAGGTAAVAFGSTTVEELAAQFRPAVLAATR